MTGDPFAVAKAAKYIRIYPDKGLGAIAELTPDLIVLGCMWPEDDAGWSLLQMLRMKPRNPIVLCTGAVK